MDVPERLIFFDDAISGGEFKRRPGLTALMGHLGEFERLIVADRSRLGRDQDLVPPLIAKLTDAEVEIWSYNDSIGKIAGPNQTPEDKLVGHISDYGSVRVRKDASRRTREGLIRVLEKGHHTGGKVYGYRSKVKLSDDKSSPLYSYLVIEPGEAKIIRQIFEAYVAGRGYTAIAKALNGDPKFADVTLRHFQGETPPSPGHLVNSVKHPNPNSWCPTCIRAMLYRDRYRGVVVWGQKENYDKGGRVHLRRAAPKEKIIEVTIPELCIVTDELWQKTRRRLKAVRKSYVRNKDGRWWGRPESGKHSKYLLSGLIGCKCCGGSMVATTFKRKGKQVRRYACSHNSKRGSTACTNTTRPMMDKLNDLVLGEIQDKILTPENVERVIKLAAKKAAERRRKQPDETAHIKRDIAELKAKIQRFLDQIEVGKAPDSVLERIERIEQQVKTKEKVLSELKLPEITDFNQFSIQRQLQENLENFREIITDRHVPRARQALRKLLGDNTFWFEPLDDGGYQLTGETRLGPLFEGCGEICGAEDPLPELYIKRIRLL